MPTRHKKVTSLFHAIMVLSLTALVNGTIVAGEKAEPNWESLSKKEIPEWMKDAKFGIYTHWGVFSVPAHGGPDYVRNLYAGEDLDRKGVYSYHVEKYGPLDKFGYKDFIPMFKAEKFNADEWVDLMYESGARFGGILLVHHDGFLLWDSEFSRWNSMNMGPKKDIYGEIAKSVRRHDDMKLIATFHHARTFGYVTKLEKNSKTPMEVKKTWDLYDPEYNDFYWNEAIGAKAEVFGTTWVGKLKEVIDKYSPDALWFDGMVASMKSKHPSEEQVRDVFAYYQNEAVKKGADVTVVNKLATSFNFPTDFGLLCYENGRDMPEDIQPWFLTDRAIGYPWSYVNDKEYPDGAGYHVKTLVDLTSRGGIFFLSLTPKGDGSVPAEEIKIMKDIGKWMKVNSGAIRNTRPWILFGEGPAEMYKKVKKDTLGFDYKQEFTASDIRFACSKDAMTLYLTTLNWPKDGKVVVKALKTESKYYDGAINKIEMFGSNEEIKWMRTDKGLEIIFPKEKPCEYAYSFKLELAEKTKRGDIEGVSLGK